MIHRRHFALLPLALAACKKAQTTDGRCPLCGMKLDPASPWRAELVTAAGPVVFDTPRCALAAWRRGKVDAKGVRVQEFYDQKWVDAAEVHFVLGSDVSGPMGADLVPVLRGRSDKFMRDHAGERAVPLDSVTNDVIESVR